MLSNFPCLHSLRNLKATQINVQCRLIQELILYKFEVGQKVTEATKNICFMKVEGVVDQSSATRGLKKFFLGCKNLNDEVMSENLKPWILRSCSKPMRQIWQVLLEGYQASLASHSPVWFVTFTFMTSVKVSRYAESCSTSLAKYCKLLTYPFIYILAHWHKGLSVHQ